MRDVTDLLEGARDAYRRRGWTSARKGFRGAREGAALSAEDLSAQADCAWWLGDLDEALPAQQDAYRLLPRRGAAAVGRAHGA